MKLPSLGWDLGIRDTHTFLVIVEAGIVTFQNNLSIVTVTDCKLTLTLKFSREYLTQVICTMLFLTVLLIIIKSQLEGKWKIKHSNTVVYQLKLLDLEFNIDKPGETKCK